MAAENPVAQVVARPTGYMQSRMNGFIHVSIVPRDGDAMESDKVDEAKAQVQGQLAAQYIQDVMQVCADPRPS